MATSHSSDEKFDLLTEMITKTNAKLDYFIEKAEATDSKLDYFIQTTIDLFKKTNDKIDALDRKIDEKVDTAIAELAEVTARGFVRIERRLDHLEGKVFAR